MGILAFVFSGSALAGILIPLLAYMTGSKLFSTHQAGKVNKAQMALEEKKLAAMIKGMTSKQGAESLMFKEMKAERGEQREYLESARDEDRSFELDKMMLGNALGANDKRMAMLTAMMGGMAGSQKGPELSDRPMPFSQLTQL